MPRMRNIALVALIGLFSVLVGVLFGYRLGGDSAVAAEHAHRGLIAAQQIARLQANQVATVAGILENDVDNGLFWGDQLLRSPSRNLYQPIFGFPAVDTVQASVQRLATYRVANPSPNKDAYASDIAAIAKRYAVGK